MRYSFEKAVVLFTFCLTLLSGNAQAAILADETETEIDFANLIQDTNEDFALSDTEMEETRGGAFLNFTNLSSSQSLAAATTDNTLSVGGNLTNGDISMGDTFGGLGSMS